jgi:hypothetical protein
MNSEDLQEIADLGKVCGLSQNHQPLQNLLESGGKLDRTTL